MAIDALSSTEAVPAIFFPRADLLAGDVAALLQPDAWPRPFAYLAHRVRQLIEVVNAQLQGQFAIERTLAKTLWGLVTRVQAKLTAHTLGVYLNVLFDRPPLALKTLVV